MKKNVEETLREVKRLLDESNEIIGKIGTFKAKELSYNHCAARCDGD